MAKVALLCLDKLGHSMAGPAIRYWELAKALSKNHEVTLLTLTPTELKSEGFKLDVLNRLKLKSQIGKQDVLITQRLGIFSGLVAKSCGVKIIIDAYAPEPLENLEYAKHQSAGSRAKTMSKATSNMIYNFKMADAVVCATEQQKNLWLGLLMGLGRIQPSQYDENRNLCNLVDIVPFGFPERSPIKNGPGAKEKFGLKASDNVLIWGGGIWNWFDPLSLIHAVHMIAQERSDVKLVFLGVKRPTIGAPLVMEMATRAIDLSDSLKLTNKHVFFNEEWVPYDQRHNYLLDGSLGVSMHFNNLETRFAFRTRILDYIWAGLPIITTKGDAFADFVEKHRLGKVVDYENPISIKDAILSLIDNRDECNAMKKNLHAIAPQFYWPHLANTLNRMIEHLSKKPKKADPYLALKATSKLIFDKSLKASMGGG